MATQAKLEQLDRQIIEEMRSFHPQSLRHLFYRMTNPRLPYHVTKSDSGYNQVFHRTKLLRRAERLPYDWFVDGGRSPAEVYFTPDLGDAVRSCRFNANPWEGADRLVQVWCESKSIASMLAPVCEKYQVACYPASGFSSITFAYQAAMRANDHPTDRLTYIYFGDYDPAGVLIDRSVQNELEEHLTKLLHFDRVGITEEQIVEYDLPTKPRTENSKRSAHITETVECEAMPIQIISQLLTDALEKYLPEGGLERAAETNRQAREELYRLADMTWEA